MISTTRAIAFGQAAVSSEAVKLVTGFELTAAQLRIAARARISTSGGVLRYRYDGGVPTASVGHTIADGATIEVLGNANIGALQFIRASTDVTVSITLEA